MHKKRKKNKIIKNVLLIIVLVLVVFVPHKFKSNNIQKKEEILEEKINIKDNEVSKSIFKSEYKKALETVSKMTLEEKVGQLFLVRYEKNDTEYLSNFYPGGYILFAKDFNNHTKDEMIKELSELQDKNKYKLILGVDEEGGFVTRVSRYPEFRSERFASPRYYYETGGLELLESTEREKAQLLKSIGLNLNLAPVADVSTNESHYINNRTFNTDAEKTSELTSFMVKIANEEKINSALKHFPGYGNNVDTHTGIAIDERSYETIKENDYKPFASGIKEKVPSVLISHNVVKSIDDKYPSSLSKKVIDELRVKLKFTGIIMTDDLDMSAVKDYVEDGAAATLAINAGNDMIITSDFITMKNEVIESVKNKKIDEETINTAVTRIMAWKYYSGIL